MLLKIDGVFDKSSLKSVIDLNLKYITFDMRPDSFNFVQLYVIEDLIKNSQGFAYHFVLQYAVEKDFMIRNAVDKLKPLLNQDQNLILQFEALYNVEFCDSFNTDFSMTYSNMRTIEPFLNSKHCKIIRLEADLITSLERTGILYEELAQLFNKLKGKDIQVELAIDWKGSIAESIFDFFEFNLISFPINQDVQSGYRQIDQSVLYKNLDYYISKFDEIKGEL